jgi:hypothetical protein
LADIVGGGLPEIKQQALDVGAADRKKREEQLRRYLGPLVDVSQEKPPAPYTSSAYEKSTGILFPIASIIEDIATKGKGNAAQTQQQIIESGIAARKARSEAEQAAYAANKPQELHDAYNQSITAIESSGLPDDEKEQYRDLAFRMYDPKAWAQNKADMERQRLAGEQRLEQLQTTSGKLTVDQRQRADWAKASEVLDDPNATEDQKVDALTAFAATYPRVWPALSTLVPLATQKAVELRFKQAHATGAGGLTPDLQQERATQAGMTGLAGALSKLNPAVVGGEAAAGARDQTARINDTKVGGASEALRLFDHAYDPVNHDWHNITTTQVGELTMAAAKVLANSNVITNEMMESITQKTLKGDLAGAFQYFGSNWIPGSTKANLDNLYSQILRTGIQAQKIRNTAIGDGDLSGFVDYKDQVNNSPKGFDSVESAEAAGYNAGDSVKINGQTGTLQRGQ